MPGTAEPTLADDGPASRWFRASVVVVTAVVVPVVMVLLVMIGHPELSVLDETAHADYLRRVEQGELPRMGDKMLEASVRDTQCRTIGGRRNAPCGLPSYEPEILAAEGYQYEAQQPPLYYVITAGLRQVIRLGPNDDFIATARATGAVWLSAGLLVFWAACRRLGCRWWPTALLTLLLAISPGVLYQSATINNDAAAILTGSLSLLLFAVLRTGVTPRRVLVWSGVAVALVMVKPIGVVAIAVGVAAVVVDAAVDRRLTVRLVGLLALPVLAGLGAYVTWSLLREARGTIDYDVVLDLLLGFKQTDQFPIDDVAGAILTFPGSYASAGAPVSPPAVANPAFIVAIAMMAGASVSLWLPKGGSAVQRAGAVGMAAMLAGGPAFTVLFYIDYSVRGGPAARYGLPLLPLIAAAAAATYTTRRSMAVLGTLGFLMLVPLLTAGL